MRTVNQMIVSDDFYHMLVSDDFSPNSSLSLNVGGRTRNQVSRFGDCLMLSDDDDIVDLTLSDYEEEDEEEWSSGMEYFINDNPLVEISYSDFESCYSSDDFIESSSDSCEWECESSSEY